jgi:hypothetical protein
MKGRPPKKSQKYPQQPVEPQPSSSGTILQKPGAKQQLKPSTVPQKPMPKPPLQKQNSNDREPSGSAPKQEKKKDGYTGGKGRLNKERHKNQFKQRGADRKMQKAAPF